MNSTECSTVTAQYMGSLVFWQSVTNVLHSGFSLSLLKLSDSVLNKTLIMTFLSGKTCSMFWTTYV